MSPVDPVAAQFALATSYPQRSHPEPAASRWIASQLALKERGCAYDQACVAIYEEHADPERMAA